MRVRLLVDSFILRARHKAGEILEVDSLDERVELLDPPPEKKGRRKKASEAPGDDEFSA